MKKLFYGFLLLLGTSLCVHGAETVSSVSFNPSRMGEYTYLKVADKAIKNPANECVRRWNGVRLPGQFFAHLCAEPGGWESELGNRVGKCRFPRQYGQYLFGV